jgi:hypothetical protein
MHILCLKHSLVDKEIFILSEIITRCSDGRFQAMMDRDTDKKA